MVDERGLACLIDPAVYGGHREVDLAAHVNLFGGSCVAAALRALAGVWSRPHA